MWNQIYKWYENNVCWERSMVEKQWDESAMRRRGEGGNREMDGRGKTRNKGSRMREFALMCAGGSQRKMAGCFQAFLSLFSPTFFYLADLFPESSAPFVRCHAFLAAVCLHVRVLGFQQILKACRSHTDAQTELSSISLFSFFGVSHIEQRVSWGSTPSPRAHANANRKAPVFGWCSPLLRGLRFSWRLLTAVIVEDYGKVHFKLQTVWTSTSPSVWCLPSLHFSFCEACLRRKIVWELRSTPFG